MDDRAFLPAGGNYRGKTMKLSAPTQVVFIISLILVVLALIGHFVTTIPLVTQYSSGSPSRATSCSRPDA